MVFFGEQCRLSCANRDSSHLTREGERSRDAHAPGHNPCFCAPERPPFYLWGMISFKSLWVKLTLSIEPEMRSSTLTRGRIPSSELVVPPLPASLLRPFLHPPRFFPVLGLPTTSCSGTHVTVHGSSCFHRPRDSPPGMGQGSTSSSPRTARCPPWPGTCVLFHKRETEAWQGTCPDLSSTEAKSRLELKSVFRFCAPHLCSITSGWLCIFWNDCMYSVVRRPSVPGTAFLGAPWSPSPLLYRQEGGLRWMRLPVTAPL